MFDDKKLNQLYNDQNDKKFITRLLSIGKKKEIKILPSAIKDDCIEYALECIQKHLQTRTGRVYIAHNPEYPDVFKVGLTKRSIIDRETSLNSAGVIGKIQILQYYECIDCIMTEALSHSRLAQYHLEKEHFQVDIDTIKSVVENSNEIVEQYYKHIVSQIGSG